MNNITNPELNNNYKSIFLENWYFYNEYLRSNKFEGAFIINYN